MLREIVVNENSVQLLRAAVTGEEVEGRTTIPVIRDRTITFDRFISKFMGSIGKSQKIIQPPNCRICETDLNGNTILVLEDEPQVRTVGFDLDFSTALAELEQTGKLEEYGLQNFTQDNPEPPYYFNLSFPYIVYFIKYDNKFNPNNFMVFFRNHPLSSRMDYLYLANLPNIPSEQNMCLGADKMGDAPVSNLIEACERTLYRFWSNAFNADYINNTQQYAEVQYVCDYLTWSCFTAVDPMFVFDVKWIPYDKNVASVMSDMASAESYVSFDKIVSLFSSTSPVEEPGSTRVDNICESVIVADMELTVGDEVVYEGVPHYIVSFRGQPGYEADEILLEDENGKESVIPLTDNSPVIKGWKELFSDGNLSSFEVNGKEVKLKDIIKISFPSQSYRQVLAIRTARDGKIEAKLGRAFYLLENIDFEVMNFDEIVIQGRTLEKDKVYYLTTGITRQYPGNEMEKLTFNEITTNSSGNLIASFRRQGGSSKGVSLDDFSYKILDDENSHSESTVRINARLFSTDDEGEIRVIPEVGCFSSHPSSTIWQTEALRAKQDILKGSNIWDVTQEKDEFDDLVEVAHVVGTIESISIPSFDLNIEFSVGDDILIADWTDVDTMLEIWKIKEFRLDEDRDVLYVHAISDSGKERDFPYIFFDSGKVNIGLMRKVSRSFSGVPAGTLIKANQAKVQNFPKKDIVEIVAFITDTGRDIPLIYCSNLCTIWATEESLSRFDAFAINSPAWKKNKTKVAGADPNKIKIQSGDLLVNDFRTSLTSDSRSLYIVRRGRWARKFVLSGLIRQYKFTNYEDVKGNIFNYGYERWGIISPRDSQVEHFARKNIPVWPNFHNWYTQIPQEHPTRNEKVFVSDGEFEKACFPEVVEAVEAEDEIEIVDTTEYPEEVASVGETTFTTTDTSAAMTPSTTGGDTLTTASTNDDIFDF